MNIRIISVIIMLFALSISLFACGVSSPTGTTGFGSATTGIPGPSGISFSAVFPVRPAAVPGLNALISASTATIKISIYDSAGNVLSSAAVTSASPSIMIPVTGYTGAVKVYITSYDSVGNITASHIHDASIYSGMTTPVSVALVEFRQGITGITGVTLMAPDSSSYTLNDLFLAPTGTSYQLGIKATKAAAGGFHLSTQNLDQTTPNGTNPPNTQLLVVNDTLSFPIDVPNASKTVWNRYQIDINFMNGFDQFGNPIPTNTPNITGTFVGAFSAPGTPVVIAPTNWLNGITWSGTQLTVVDGTGVVLTSTDDLNWPQRTTPVTGTSGLNAITWSGSQYVAVGGMFFTTSTILTSPDGIAWTQRTSPTTNVLSSVTWSPLKALFVAVDSSGFIYTSPDGITWTQQTSPVQNVNGLLAVTWSSPLSLFVAIGSGGKILTSPDGLVWTVQPTPTTAILRGIVSATSQLVVVGDGTILTSPNGTTWTAQTSPTAASIESVTWSGTQYVAVGVVGTVITSPNGIAWTAGTSGVSNSLFGITWTGTKFVAVGDAGTIISSPDGITWSRNIVAGTSFSAPNATWAAYTVPTLPLAPASIIF